MNKELIVLAGPTAIGKTGAGIKIAKALETEIISADSRQIYKEMSVGTAVPSSSELKQVKHHFIQTISIQGHYNASSYEFEALKLLEKLFGKYDKVLMVGGSGLYIDAVLFGIDDLPSPDSDLRKHLQEKLLHEGIESLRNDLRFLDPVSYNRIDLKNPKRVQKALEVTLQTGRPYSTFLTSPRRERSFKTRMICLNTSREKLYQNINKRVLQMIDRGLVDEVASLESFKHLNALKTVGYKEIFTHLEGKITLSEAIEKIQNNTRKYARKQITWFRKYKDCKWFEPQDSEKIIRWIKENED